jgi:hypothetical protein
MLIIYVVFFSPSNLISRQCHGILLRFIFRSVCKSAKGDYLFGHVHLSARPSFHLHGTTLLHWTDFHEMWYSSIFRKYFEIIQMWSNLTRITGTLHEDMCTFMILSRWILVRVRNVSDKNCRENENTHFTFSNFFPRKSCHVLYNVEKYRTARQATHYNKIRRMRFACWVTKAIIRTHTRHI